MLHVIAIFLLLPPSTNCQNVVFDLWSRNYNTSIRGKYVNKYITNRSRPANCVRKNIPHESAPDFESNTNFPFYSFHHFEIALSFAYYVNSFEIDHKNQKHWAAVQSSL